MTLIEEIEDFFGTKDLYEVLNVSRDATEDLIKKAYRKASLKIHPDRVEEEHKAEATKRFQALARVHFVLSDPERRKLYDDHDIIANEDGLDNEADWDNYWRLLFPKVTENDINNFLDKYIGSKDEQKDLIAIYNRYQGDLDKISQTHIAYDEQRTVDDLKQLIEDGKIEEFDNFVNEPESKKARRNKKVQREAKQAAKVKKDKPVSDISDLTALIQRKSEKGFNSMIASLEAKYGGNSNKRVDRGTKRKRGNKN